MLAFVGFVWWPILTFAQQSISSSSEVDIPTFVTSDDNPATVDYWACFSPDGQNILFSRRQGQRGKWDLFIVPTSGGQARSLTEERLAVSSTRASWSISNRIASAGV